MKDKLIIGRKEIADLPSFQLYNKIMKIDTGAYTSSIDVVSSVLKDNVLHVQFVEDGPIVTFSTFKMKRIKSSNGVVQERFVIDGVIEIGGQQIHTPFSLTDRSGMKYPILLGRKFLNKRFLVDTSKVNLLKTT
jgi:hypothetical protein